MDRSDHGSLNLQFKPILLLLLLSSLAVAVAAANSSSPSPTSNSITGPFSSRLGNQSPNITTSSTLVIIPILNSTDLSFAFGWVPISYSDDNAPTGPSTLRCLLSIVYLPYLDPQHVWIANRDRPVSSGATLSLSSTTGSLLLTDSDQSRVVWSSSSGARAGNASTLALSLLDHGNLVLSSASGGIVWQSFDHPTDTILPGQVLSTGARIVSSVSSNNVSSGAYSVVIEPAGVVMYVRVPAAMPSASLPYHIAGFSSGQNNTVESVTGPALCKSTRVYYSAGGQTFRFEEESPSRKGVTCNRTFDIQIASNDNNTHVFVRVDHDGNVRSYVHKPQYGWAVDQELFSSNLYCQLPNRCGTYGVCSDYGSCTCPTVSTIPGQQLLFRANNPSDPAQGCALSQPPSCPVNNALYNASDDANYFVELIGATYFANDYVFQGTTSSLDQCKSLCASTCNCSVAFYQEDSGSCHTYGYTMSIEKAPGLSSRAYIKVGRNATTTGLASPMPRPHSTWMLSNVAILLIVISSLLILVLVVSFTLLGVKIMRRLGAMEDEDAFLESLPGLPTRYTLKELDRATNGFQRQLGSGGFGTVYEGTLRDGTMVAVKRLESARQGQKEFHAELATLGSINHINLVRLRGFCTQRSHCLLVYDHMAHGSLDRWLFSDSKVLDWRTRRSIALDTARGLAFLHEESRECIVHLDIKPQNILLDVSFLAKISDFGLSKLMSRDEADVVTNVRGTPGYVAPEWLLQVGVTSKSDVYSFGMVLLELVSGRRNVDLSRNTYWYFPSWAVTLVEDNRTLEILDERLRLDSMTDDMVKEVERFIKVTMWCIQEDPILRPCMSSVVRMLQGHSEVKDAPSLLDFAMRTTSTKTSSSSNPGTSVSHKSFSSTSTHISNSILSAPR